MTALSGIRPQRFADAIDEIASTETPAMAWVRQVAPIARRMNEESRIDPIEDPSS